MATKNGGGGLNITSSLTSNSSFTIQAATAVLSASGSIPHFTWQIMSVSAVLSATASLATDTTQMSSFTPLGQECDPLLYRWGGYEQDAWTVVNRPLLGAVQQGAAVLSASGSIVASAFLRQVALATLPASSSLISSGSLLLTASAVLSASSSIAANGTNSVKQATAVLAASSSMFDGVTQRQMVSAVLAATASLVASPSQIGSIVTRSAQQLSVQSWPRYWQKLPTIGRMSFIPPSNVGATLSAGGSMIARATVRQAATAILGASASVRATGSGGSTATFFTLGQESDTLARPWRWYRDEGYSVPSFLPTPSGPQVLQATAILAASSSIRALASGAVTQQATAILAATASMAASGDVYRIVARNALLGQTRRWPRYNVLSEVFQRGHNQTVTIQTATAILAANASLIAAPNQVMQAATVLAATSSLIVAGTRYSPTSAVLSASSQLSANANQRMAASATLTATASLVAATTQRMIGKVVLAASASLVADSSTGTAPQGSAVLAATASLISSAIRFSPTSAVLAASGAMIASSTSIILAGRSTMAASASVIADTRMALAAYAGLQATSAMIAAPGQIHVETVSQIFVAETAMIANGFVHGPVPTEPSADHTMIGPPFLILGQ